MKEFKGTPGPWLASKTDRSIGPVSRDDDQSYGMLLPVAWVEFYVEPGLHHANANLIAAAPDLLEALQNATRVLEAGKNVKFPDWIETIQKSKAAISKTLGE